MESASIRRLATHLGIDIDDAALGEVITQNSMQRHISAEGSPSDRAGRHRRHGVVGDWRQKLTSRDLVLIMDAAGERMRLLGYV